MASGPGRLHFAGININKKDNMTVSTDVDDKLDSLYEFMLAHTWRKQSSIQVIEFEKAIFCQPTICLA